MSRVGTWNDVVADEESGVKDFTEDGKCSGCGNCCANFLPISDVEIKRIKRYVMEHGITESVCRYPLTKPLVDITCPFRDEVAKKCKIYQVRPAICRDFVCNKSPESLKRNKELYQGKYGVADMRAVFFGRENKLAEILREVF